MIHRSAMPTVIPEAEVQNQRDIDSLISNVNHKTYLPNLNNTMKNRETSGSALEMQQTFNPAESFGAVQRPPRFQPMYGSAGMEKQSQHAPEEEEDDDDAQFKYNRYKN